MTGELGNLRAALRWVLLASGAAVMILLGQSKIALDHASFAPVFASISLLAVGGLVCARRGLLVSSLIMEVLACGLAFSVVALIATYLSISLDFPLTDEALAAMDRWMGFDGVAYIRFIDGFPTFSLVLALAYASFAWQLMLLPMLFIVLGHPARAFSLVLAYALVCCLASLISIWVPALGSYGFFAVDLSALEAINPHFVRPVIDQFNAVRGQAEFVLSLETAQGIVTFPSVHAAVALLCAATAFGVRLLRYPFLGLNVLMGLSTVSHSNHYLIDVFAGFGGIPLDEIGATGFGVAAISLACIRAISRRPAATRAYAFQLSGERSAG